MPSLTNMPLIISVRPYSTSNQPNESLTGQTTNNAQDLAAAKGSIPSSPIVSPSLETHPPDILSHLPGHRQDPQKEKSFNVITNAPSTPLSFSKALQVTPSSILNQKSPISQDFPNLPSHNSARKTVPRNFVEKKSIHSQRPNASNKTPSLNQRTIPSPVTIISSPSHKAMPHLQVEIVENDQGSFHMSSNNEKPVHIDLPIGSPMTKDEVHTHSKATQTPTTSIYSSPKNNEGKALRLRSKTRKMFSCKECGRGFQQYKNLRRHVKERHPMELNELAPSLRRLSDSNSAYACDICKKYFSEMSTLQRHAKNFHGYSTTRAIPCSLCDFMGESCKNIVQHFENDHHINIVKETFIFSNKEEFLSWKEDIEKSSYVRYVKYCGSRKNENSILEYFHCHRSGIYIPRGEGKRNMKFQGSNKINGYCPSKITVTYTKDKVTAIFIKTHIGHQGEIERITLTHKERTFLAEKIAQNIPFSEILKDVRGSTSEPENLSRLHLLKRKDLHNIKREFDLQSSNLVHNDTTLQEWVEEMNKEEDSPILFFKPKGQEAYPFDSYHLNRDDFFLAIMNDLQSEMLLEYGRNIICVDTIHRPDNKSFDLTSILVVDSRNHGFPVAFLISNKTDHRILSIFFKLIEEKVGTLSPNVFMSNMDNYYSTAWSTVMESPNYWLFCSWNVDFVWRKNLFRVQTPEKQFLVYKIIRMTLEENDKRSFLSNLQQAISAMLDDDYMLDFGVYFKENFGENYESWAYSFRTNVINSSASTHVERMHKTIKCIYLEGNKNKRLDSAINTIMRFVRDDLYSSLTALPLERLDHKFLIWSNAHASGEALGNHFKIDALDGKTWNVSSPSTGELYNIKELVEECFCSLKCEACSTCIHNYACDCFDSSIHWNMCEHIHLIGQLNRGPSHPSIFSSSSSRGTLAPFGNQGQADGMENQLPLKWQDAGHQSNSAEAVEPLLALSYATPSSGGPSPHFQTEQALHPPARKRPRLVEELQNEPFPRQSFHAEVRNTARKSLSVHRR